MNPRALIQAAKVLKHVGPKKMGNVGINKAIASTVLPITYDMSPKLLAWTWMYKPNVARWAIANNRSVWEHPQHGMDILLKFDKIVTKGRSAKQISQYGDQMRRLSFANTQMKKINPLSPLDRVDVIHDMAKNRDPIFRGLFGLSSASQKGANPLYLGLGKAIKSKGASSVRFNPANVRGKDLIAEARLLARTGNEGNISHNVMGRFSADKKHFWDIWDFAQNNPQKLRQLQGEAFTNIIRDPSKSYKATKSILIRYAREALNSRVNPIKIEGPII